MNINVQKVKNVIIKDADGKIVMNFRLGYLGTNTNRSDKSITLEIAAAKPE